MTTPDPGIYPGVSMTDYASWDAVRHSTLAQARYSPAHMRMQELAGKANEKGSKAMMIGSATHAAIFEPDLFASQYFRVPSARGVARTRALARAAAAGKATLTESDYDMISKLAEAVRARVGPLLSIAARENEVCYVWRDAETGLLCKARADALIDRRTILDLKTAREGGADAFRRSMWKYGYDIQAAMYLDGLSQLTGRDAEITFIVVEKHRGLLELDPSACVSTHPLSSDTLESAKAKYRAYLRTYADCKAADLWPGHKDETIELPGSTTTSLAVIEPSESSSGEARYED